MGSIKEKPRLKCPTNPFIPTVSDTRRPGDGFYKYVNESWIHSHHIKKWQSEFDVSDEITKETDKELLRIIHDLPHIQNTHLTPIRPREHLQLLGYIWKNKTVESEENYLQTCMHELMESRGLDDISKFLGWMVRCSIPTILDLTSMEELEKPYMVRATVSPGSLMLPLKYYLKSSLKNTDIWKAYEEFIGICSIELGLPFLYKAIATETRVASILDKSSAHLSTSKKGGVLKSQIPGFPWDSFMKGVDIDTRWEHRIWTINSVEQFRDLLKWFSRTDEESLLSLLSIHLICVAAPFMRPKIREAHSNLFQKALMGVDTAPPQETIMLRHVKDILPDVLCNLYSEKHKDTNVLDDIKTFISSLKDAAVDLMGSTEVFSKKTKSRAVEKIHRMWFEIGKGKSSPLPHVTYNPESFLHTMFSIKAARTRMIPSITGKSADKLHSSYPCFLTNASYYEETNHIVIPWGILQWPFYCLEAPLGWNHGGIGATICHEMTHGFDLEGSLYSPRGAYKEWWTRKNRNTFKRETRSISKFFSKFKHFGAHLNGDKTLSENWADLGGLTIALRGLKKELLTVSDEEKKEAYRNFFISYAVSWRTIIRKKTMLYTILTSVHAPGEDRVDRIVPQFQEWVDAFDIKESDPLYLPKSKRLKFF